MIAPTLLALIAFISFVIVIALELYNAARLKKLMEPTYELELRRADEAAAHIVERAREEARRLLEKAEADSISLATARASKEQAAEHHYDSDLHSLFTAFKTQLADAARSAEDSYREANESLLAEASKYSADAERRTAEIYASLEQAAKAQIEEQIARAFKAAQEVALQYERTQKDAIDASIFDIVARTVKGVLQKDMPEETQADLVRAALNEAKTHAIF